MKTKYLILSFVLSLAFTACKKEQTTTDSPEAATAPPVKENFSVELDVAAKTDDNFAVYFTEDGTINFDGDHAVWSGIKGGDQVQTVMFNLSEAVLPTHIRLDFGLNKEQGDVTVHKIKMMYYGKAFEIKGSEFFTYFIENKDVQTTVDASKGTITFLQKEGAYSPPFYYPHQALLDQIAKITK